MFVSGLGSPRWHLVFRKDVQALYCLLQLMISLTVQWYQPSIQSRMELLYVLYAEYSKFTWKTCFVNFHAAFHSKLLYFLMCWLTYCINCPCCVQNTSNHPRLSPPNSSSGRSTLPPASSWYGTSRSIPLSFTINWKWELCYWFPPFLYAGGIVTWMPGQQLVGWHHHNLKWNQNQNHKLIHFPILLLFQVQ